MLQEEKISNPLEGTFSQIRKSLSKNEDITDLLIRFINTAILESANDEESFHRKYEMLIAYLIVNAPEQEKITAEAIPGHTVAGASNNIVKFSRATQMSPTSKTHQE